MLRYTLHRLLQAIVSVFGLLTIVFIVMRLSGDPTYLLVPEGASPEAVASLRHELGFDRPIYRQYADYLGQLARLDLGESYVEREPAVDIVASRLPYTATLALAALFVAVAIGIPVGALMAMRQGRWQESALAGLVLTGQSMPTFLSGMLMILLFGVALGWLPTSGSGDFAALIMPAVALGAVSMATFARMTRISVLDELGKDYVRAARARGLNPARTVLRHVARNAAIPVITVAALEIGNLMAGAVVVETVFAWPGIGQLAIQSIQSRDFQVVQVVVLLISITYVIIGFLADVIYAAIDPRIRLVP
jgi:peptide/nickel transport system permease protein